MPGIPTDEQINEAARNLGYADDAGNCLPAYRSKVARAVQLAEREDAAAERAQASLDEPIALIVDAHQRLADELGHKAATAIAASLAPVLYRTAQSERNRDNARTA
jgi:hypothetical protein